MPLTQLPLHQQAKQHSGTALEVDSTIITADGAHPFTGDQDCGDHKLTGLADPVNPQDAVNLRSMVSGTGGDKTYVHTQIVSATTWNVPHNLGKFPAITIATSAGDTVLGNIHHVDNNNAVLTFSAPFSGSAYCN